MVGDGGRVTLEIIGAGWGRTGTESLREALELLDFGPCHHMHAIRDRPELMADWTDFADGKHRDWDRLFNGFRSQLDFPGAAYWRELSAHFPAAKVILTIRDPESWYDSLSATVFKLFEERDTIRDPQRLAALELSERLVGNGVFGGHPPDRDYFIGRFNAHNAEVQAGVPPNRLLVYSVAEGWAPLCGFLGRPVPDRPFPFRNDAKDYRSGWK
jgi:hypothetical protein